MPAKLRLPDSLDHLKYFIVRYDRETEEFELIEPNRTQTYVLGDAFATRAYFDRIGLEYLGGRAMDSALAFGASQAIVKERRAFGLDLCKVDLDAGLIRKVDIDEDRDIMSERDADELVA